MRTTAAGLLRQVKDAWDLDKPLASAMLNWSATLHEIGLDISHNGFQRHGAYIAENADLPGFPRSEQKVLAFLIASQRGQIDAQRLAQIPSAWRRSTLRLAVLLRLGVLLNRSRNSRELPPADVTASERVIVLDFPDDWLAANPLTVADLRREQTLLADANIELKYC